MALPLTEAITPFDGSVLGSLLFITYIHKALNDLDSGLSNKIYKFADDTQLAARVEDYNESLKLQRDIDKLIG